MISLAFCRFCGRFPHHFFKFVPQFLNSFLHFPPTAFALGSSAIVMALGQNDTFVFLGSLQQIVFASQKVLWSVPQTVLYVGLTIFLRFFGQMAVASERVLWRVPPTLHLSPKLLQKSSLEGSANSVSSWGQSCVNC